jgi:hypothetical protein
MDSKSKKPIFDRIEKIDSLPGGKGSIWQGDRGRYIIRHTEHKERQKPVAHVILNHRYFTGLFRTKLPSIYSADIKTAGGKQYLLFVMDKADSMNIYQKKHVGKS